MGSGGHINLNVVGTPVASRGLPEKPASREWVLGRGIRWHTFGAQEHAPQDRFTGRTLDIKPQLIRSTPKELVKHRYQNSTGLAAWGEPTELCTLNLDR